MTNGQVDGLEADLEFSWNQRFDKPSKSILQMNAVFMPVIALVSAASGRPCRPPTASSSPRP